MRSPRGLPLAPSSAGDGPVSHSRLGGRLGNPWVLVLSLGLGVFVGGFDQTFIVPVLSRVLADLDIDVSQFGKASWIINGYLLGYTVAMPVMGRVADVYGHRRIFLISLAIFMGGSVLVALAPNLLTLTIARGITAIGGGALVPVALAIAADSLPDRQRPLGLSTISVLDDASSLLGPLWGTLIGVWLGWRGLFWMNIILGLPVVVLVLLIARERAPLPGVRVDWLGGLLLGAALLSVTFALADTGAEKRALSETIAFFAAGGVLLALFLWQELRTDQPLIDPRMFRAPRFSAAMVVFFLEGAALITALVNIPLMAEVLWEKTGAGPGLMLSRMVLFMIAGGVAGGLLAPRVGYRWTAVIGFVFAAVGLLWMRAWAQVPAESARWGALAAAGIGFTLVDAPVYATVVDAVSAGRRASATALLQVMQTTGMIVAMALLASKGLGRFNDRAAATFQQGGFGDVETYRRLQHETFDETFLVAGLLMVAAAAIALLLDSRRGAGFHWADVYGSRPSPSSTSEDA